KHTVIFLIFITEIRKPLNILSLPTFLDKTIDFGVVFQPSARASRFDGTNVISSASKHNLLLLLQ
ncbi:hypothetical protein QCB52_11425, partial [Myroides odoratimimus]|uniref:hypothetical protein n=1 Tax=Myroides odoratimimus TaxID=76832 RepID=UPI0038B73248